MRKHKLYEPYGDQRSETVVFGVLGFAGLVTLGLALAVSLEFARDRDRVVAAWSGNTPAGGHYQSLKWRAEARTMAEAIRYLLEPESDPSTIGPTNSHSNFDRRGEVGVSALAQLASLSNRK